MFPGLMPRKHVASRARKMNYGNYMRSRSANVNARRPERAGTHVRYGHGVLRPVYRGERVGGKDAGDVPEEAVKQRRRGRTQPKGRQVEPEALAEVRELLG